MSTPVRRQAMEGKIQAGDTWVTRRTFSEDETMVFGDLIRDYNPVHYDERFAAVKKFPNRILHGMLTASMVCEPGGQSAWLATSMSFKFLKPVHFGDTIELRLTILTLDERGFAEAEAIFTNQHGEKVIEGSLEGFVPGEQEKEVLSQMVEEGDPTNKLREKEE